MTSPNPMTREELIELAGLDAYGLLDEYEAALYTRSFHHAPATVQDEVLELQAKLAIDDSFLPEELPQADLRGRVLGAVREAIEQETSELEPIASIGRRPSVVDRPTRVASFTVSPASARSLSRFVLGGAGVWRAAAFVLCGAVIVLAYFWSDARREGERISTLAISEITSVQLERLLGPTAKDFLFDPALQTTVLHAVEPAHNSGPGARSVMLIGSGGEEALLVTEGLIENVEYTLSVLGSDGVVHTVTRFKTNGGLSGVMVSLADIPLGPASTWTISSSDGVALLASA